MNVINRFLAYPLFRSPLFLALVWLGATATACLLKYLRSDFCGYNNFLIFRNSFRHAMEQLPLYAYYPAEYMDHFLYGISFTAVVAPFSYLPPLAGMLAWCLSNSLLLFVAIRKLDLTGWKFAAIIWLCVNELFTSALMAQYNIAVAGLVILSFACIEKKKEFWAAFFIALGVMTKVYGIVGLLFFFFCKRRIIFSAGLIFWFAVLLVLPMLYTSPHYVLEQYGSWFATLTEKNQLNMQTDFTNISLLGMVRKISGIMTYSDLWLIVPGVLFFAAPLVRINQYENKPFRLLYLASALLFLVLFSTGTENSGYIAAMVGVSLWYVTTPTRSTTPGLNTGLLIFCFILTSLSTTDIFPAVIRKNYVVPYALKALPCVLIWLKIIWEQMTQDFAKPLTSLQPRKAEKIDIILPCYNPREGWEQLMIAKYTELQEALKDKQIRFILVNDASVRGITPEIRQQLSKAIPNLLITDHPENRGKGAAVRTGIGHATSEITLYTDYDFPYSIGSIVQMVGCLEKGYDVTNATRNHTYYMNLTLKRKIMSYGSRFLNFLVLGLTHTDTQGGLKGFNSRGKQYMMATRVNRFLFDTEFIYLASKDTELTIKDMPVDLRSEVHLPDMRRGVLAEELKNLFRIACRG